MSSQTYPKDKTKKSVSYCPENTVNILCMTREANELKSSVRQVDVTFSQEEILELHVARSTS